jgi:hypothetical protein
MNFGAALAFRAELEMDRDLKEEPCCWKLLEIGQMGAKKNYGNFADHGADDARAWNCTSHLMQSTWIVSADDLYEIQSTKAFVGGGRYTNPITVTQHVGAATGRNTMPMYFRPRRSASGIGADYLPGLLHDDQ